jgi:TetR/AcrR family transcriptional repressor of nem operon
MAPLKRIERFFVLLAQEHSSNRFEIGCLIGNLSLELSNHSAEVRSTLADILGKWEAALAMCIQEAFQNTDSAKAQDAHKCAAILIESWEGATLRTKIERNGDAFQRFLDTTLPLVLAN